MRLVAFRRRRLAAALPWLCFLLGCGSESPSKASGVRSAGVPALCTAVGYSGTDAPRVVLLGHSTALSGALVSPINPRAIVISTTKAARFGMAPKARF